MTLVTEGDGEMNREELNSKVEKYCKNNLKLILMCGGLFCPDCPLYIKNNDEERCARGDDEVKEVLEEVWAEAHGYIKKEDLRPKVNEEFIDNLVALLQREATFSVIKNVIGCEGELWMGEEDQEDNWYKWIMKNLFIEDTEEDVNALTYTPSKQGKYTDNDGKPIPQELSSISCVVKIKDKWDYLKDTLKVIYKQETCISKKDAYKKVIKIMEEYEA